MQLSRSRYVTVCQQLLVTGAVLLLVLGAVGLVSMRASSAPVSYAGHSVPWWLPLLALGLVTAVLSYTTGIAAGRRLGSRLASFVALLEVLFSVVFAWVLLGELPSALQLFGGLLVLAGVVVVKLGEPAAAGSAVPSAELTATPGTATGSR